MSIICTILVLVAFTISNAYAIKLNEKDYIITDFGIASGNPFITVEGTAGGSYDPSMGDEGYEAYVFDTDKGFFQVTVAEGESKSYYSTDHLLVKEIKLNECLLSESTHGKPHFDNNTVQYIDNNQNFTKVNKAFAIQVSVDDPDGKCKSGEHIQKIFPNQTTVMKTQTSKTTSPVVKNTTFVGGTPGAVDIDTSKFENPIVLTVNTMAGTRNLTEMLLSVARDPPKPDNGVYLNLNSNSSLDFKRGETVNVNWQDLHLHQQSSS